MVSDWREIAEWDWVVLGYGQVLHAVRTVTNDADEDWFADGDTECGRTGEMHIPGIMARMGADRCRRCCDRTGMPRGRQSPKNVEACRPIAEDRIAALAGDRS